MYLLITYINIAISQEVVCMLYITAMGAGQYVILLFCVSCIKMYSVFLALNIREREVPWIETSRTSPIIDY